MDILPKNPVMLLSVVNTNLRDFYDNLDEFCLAKDVKREDIISILQKIGYKYDDKINQFI